MVGHYENKATLKAMLSKSMNDPNASPEKSKAAAKLMAQLHRYELMISKAKGATKARQTARETSNKSKVFNL